MRKKTLPFRLYAQILIFFAFIALGALILWPLQQALFGGMISIRDNLINRLEKQLGRKVRYSSISPSLFGSFDVRNVSITGVDEIPVLTMSRFRVAYSLPDLLLRKTRAIRSVRIDTPFIDFHTSRDNDLLEMIENTSSGQDSTLQDFTEMLPDNLLVYIRNGKCLINSGKEQFEFDGLNFDIEISDDRVIFDGKWDIGIAVNQPVMAPVNVNLTIQAVGSCQTDFAEGEAVLSIPSVTGDVSSVLPVVFNLGLKDGALSLSNAPEQCPFDISLVYMVDEGNYDARLACADLTPKDFFSLSGGLENLGQLLEIGATGEALVKRGSDGSLAYSLNFSGAADTGGFEVFPASFEILANGDENHVYIDTFHISMPGVRNESAFIYGSADFSGSIQLEPFSPEGVLSFKDFSLSGSDGINADITINASANEIYLSSNVLRMGKVNLAAFKALARSSEDSIGYSISALRYANNGSFNGARPATISLNGSVNSESRNLEAKLVLDSFPAGDLVDLALPFVKSNSSLSSIRGLLGAVTVTTEVVLATDSENVEYYAPRIVVAGGPDNDFTGSVSVSGTQRNFELSDGRVVWKDESLYMAANADFTDNGNIDFSVNASYRNLGYQIEGSFLDGKSVNINGSYGLNVNLASSAGGGYSGTVRAENFPVPFLGHPALLTLTSGLRYNSADSWLIELERFETRNISGPAGLTHIAVSGAVNQAGVHFPYVYFSDGIGPLTGRADLSWNNNFSRLTGTVALAEGRERYNIEGSFTDSRFDLAVSGLLMRLDRLTGKRDNALADGDIRLFWNSEDSFYAELNLASLNMKIMDQEFKASGRAVMDSNELSVSGLKFSFAGFEGNFPQLSVNGGNGKAETFASIKGNVGERRAEASLLLTAGFKPVKSLLNIGDALDSFEGAARIRGFRFDNEGQPQAFDVVFSRSGNAVSVSGGPRNMLRLNIDDNGNFYAGLSSPCPVRGTVIGNITDRIINARCSDLYVDFAALFNILPKQQDIYLTGGYANAAFDIRGPISDPEFFGTARGTSLRFRIPDFVTQEVRPIPFNVAIDGNEMRFGPVSIVAGSGAGKIAGWFRFDRWIPNVFSIDIDVPRETPIPYGFTIPGFTVQGETAGLLNVSMEDMVMSVSGDLYANNSLMGVNSDTEVLSQINTFDAETIHSVVNLSVQTGPVVEFVYPDSRFSILRANPDIGTKVYITSDTRTKQFSINSDVRIRSGEIFYFERSFYIRSGLLSFRENENRFEPRLTARAELRDRNEDGPVTISLIVDNAPLTSFTARFESTPSLSQMEILSLLGQSIMGNQQNEDENAVQRAFISSTADFLTQLYIVKQLERQIRNFTGLDMFSIRTQFLQNLVFTASGLMPQPVDRTGGVGNYIFNNTTVFGGKYIGQDMFIQGMLSMRYDENKSSFGGLTFEPDIGLELQGPIMFNNYNFLIRWAFVPMHPENWYVNDNSITLTWSKSF